MEVYVSFGEKFELVCGFALRILQRPRFFPFYCSHIAGMFFTGSELARHQLHFSWSEDGEGKGRGC